jgi:hypothetical protein
MVLCHFMAMLDLHVTMDILQWPLHPPDQTAEQKMAEEGHTRANQG